MSTVYVKFEQKHTEWGEETGGEIYGVFTEEGMKEDCLRYLDKAKQYVSKQLAESREKLNRCEKTSKDYKTALSVVPQEIRMEMQYRYENAKKTVEYWKKIVTDWKKISHSDIEMCKVYMEHEFYIVYEIHEVKKGSIEENKQ